MVLSKEKQKLVHRLRSRRLRAKEGLFLVEGVRAAKEFLVATIPVNLRFAIVSPRLREIGGGPELEDALAGREIPLEKVDDKDLNALSDTEQTQGVLLVAEEPEVPWPPKGATFRSRFLLLDGIQDPGNVGTLVRAARAFGLDAVLALEGTTDPWGPKVVRGGAGASAHIPVAKVPWHEAGKWMEEMCIPLLAAEAGGRDVRDFRPSGGWALVLGNEGAGVRREIRDAALESLAIRMAGGVDSLNVAMAGAVLLFALATNNGHHGRA